MIRRARLRLWLIALDVAELLRLPIGMRSWALRRACAVVHYDPLEPEPPESDRPF